MQTFRTFRFHTEEGHRLAIFGKLLPGFKIEIVIFKCAISDTFSKEVARAAHGVYETRGRKGCEAIGFHPYVDTINIKIGQTVRQAFDEFCQENFVNPYVYSEVTVLLPTKRLKEFQDLMIKNNF